MNKLKKYVDYKQFGLGILNFFIYLFVQIIFIKVFNNQINNGSALVTNLIFIASDLTVLILLILIQRKRLIKDYHDFDLNYAKYLKIGIKYYLLGFIGMYVANIVITLLVPNALANNEAINRQAIFAYPAYSIIAMIVTGPFIEELVFRSSYQKAFKNKYWYIIFVTLLFAGMHVIPTLTSAYDLLYLIPYGCLSLSFAITYYKTQNIFTTTIIHTFHNTICVLLIIILKIFGLI